MNFDFASPGEGREGQILQCLIKYVRVLLAAKNHVFSSGKSFFLAHSYTLIFVSQLSILIVFLHFIYFQITLRHLHEFYELYTHYLK